MLPTRQPRRDRAASGSPPPHRPLQKLEHRGDDPLGRVGPPHAADPRAQPLEEVGVAESAVEQMDELEVGARDEPDPRSGSEALVAALLAGEPAIASTTGARSDSPSAARAAAGSTGSANSSRTGMPVTTIRCAGMPRAMNSCFTSSAATQ